MAKKTFAPDAGTAIKLLRERHGEQAAVTFERLISEGKTIQAARYLKEQGIIE